jgi:hypothetical protein
MEIKVEYDGEYPNLCRGDLIVYVDGKQYIFPDYCLSSGGSIYFDDDYQGHITKGKWEVYGWPEDMPDNIKQAVLNAINESIPHGCCGGCI